MVENTPAGWPAACERMFIEDRALIYRLSDAGQVGGTQRRQNVESPEHQAIE